jgi:hemerythrin-like domain-containing protein
MQRHPALRKLSSDHHRGLVLARRLADAANRDSATRAKAWALAMERFQTELEPHFQVEETSLLPAVRTATRIVTGRTHAA